jgi:hypothetical protein
MNSFILFVIPAKAGIQNKQDWIPHQVQNDDKSGEKVRYKNA